MRVGTTNDFQQIPLLPNIDRNVEPICGQDVAVLVEETVLSEQRTLLKFWENAEGYFPTVCRVFE
jgi:hypothetical protein